ncbi:hypothetical protein G5B40_13265 [Pikeienuella piscinae]|uniref:Uncharacterized protein n=1 Tax=Pikeienuella piscinae TaxID=2748098 RepID=A0A7L5BZT0_9RHOB|nr:hypothetical protein [Pikeienuella piscinae]QIE56348.1 hypothetical protein G5B40_13265 [Pikeienuella piscinae]
MAFQEAHDDFGAAREYGRRPVDGGLWRLGAAIALNMIVGYGIVAALDDMNLPDASGVEWHGNVARSVSGR